MAATCNNIGFEPRFIDCGGGLPCPGDNANQPNPEHCKPADLAGELACIRYVFPRAEEVWLENGRFLTGRAGVLVVSVVDIKERPECRYLICDGGRTNHAIISAWEEHNIIAIPPRHGRKRYTTVCGPTCMAFDRLNRMSLPEDLTRGDLLVWQNAGSYHIPWETRFSHGYAPVIWIDEKSQMSLARSREAFGEWWRNH
jgi:diaminopimelate decarboxylase